MFSGFSAVTGSEMTGEKQRFKSCRQCRLRKQKCDRSWPSCAQCLARGERGTCDWSDAQPLQQRRDEAEELASKLDRLEDYIRTSRSKRGSGSSDPSTPSAGFNPLTNTIGRVEGYYRPSKRTKTVDTADAGGPSVASVSEPSPQSSLAPRGRLTSLQASHERTLSSSPRDFNMQSSPEEFEQDDEDGPGATLLDPYSKNIVTALALQTLFPSPPRTATDHRSELPPDGTRVSIPALDGASMGFGGSEDVVRDARDGLQEWMMPQNRFLQRTNPSDQGSRPPTNSPAAPRTDAVDYSPSTSQITQSSTPAVSSLLFTSPGQSSAQIPFQHCSLDQLIEKAFPTKSMAEQLLEFYFGSKKTSPTPLGKGKGKRKRDDDSDNAPSLVESDGFYPGDLLFHPHHIPTLRRQWESISSKVYQSSSPLPAKGSGTRTSSRTLVDPHLLSVMFASFAYACGNPLAGSSVFEAEIRRPESDNQPKRSGVDLGGKIVAGDLARTFIAAAKRALDIGDAISSYTLDGCKARLILARWYLNRSDESPDWDYAASLLAKAACVACRLNLHRDPGKMQLRLSFLEREERRRLMWYIASLDWKASGLYTRTSSPVDQSFFDVNLPLDLDDEDLDNSSVCGIDADTIHSAPPMASENPTPMTLFRFDCRMALQIRRVMLALYGPKRLSRARIRSLDRELCALEESMPPILRLKMSGRDVVSDAPSKYQPMSKRWLSAAITINLILAKIFMDLHSPFLRRSEQEGSDVVDVEWHRTRCHRYALFTLALQRTQMLPADSPLLQYAFLQGALVMAVDVYLRPSNGYTGEVLAATRFARCNSPLVQSSVATIRYLLGKAGVPKVLMLPPDPTSQLPDLFMGMKSMVPPPPPITTPQVQTSPAASSQCVQPPFVLSPKTFYQEPGPQFHPAGSAYFGNPNHTISTYSTSSFTQTSATGASFGINPNTRQSILLGPNPSPSPNQSTTSPVPGNNHFPQNMTHFDTQTSISSNHHSTNRDIPPLPLPMPFLPQYSSQLNNNYLPQPRTSSGQAGYGSFRYPDPPRVDGMGSVPSQSHQWLAPNQQLQPPFSYGTQAADAIPSQNPVYPPNPTSATPAQSLSREEMREERSDDTASGGFSLARFLSERRHKLGAATTAYSNLPVTKPTSSCTSSQGVAPVDMMKASILEGKGLLPVLPTHSFSLQTTNYEPPPSGRPNSTTIQNFNTGNEQVASSSFAVLDQQRQLQSFAAWANESTWSASFQPQQHS